MHSKSPISPMSCTFDGKKSPSQGSLRKKDILKAKRLTVVDLEDIENYILSELRQIRHHPEHSKKECYVVYKHAFDQMIENTVVFKSILSAVKAEYEDCIETLEAGQSHTIYLEGMTKALLSEKANLRQFTQRGDELEEKVEKLNEHGVKLRGKIHELRKDRARRIASAESKSMQSAVKETRLLIPGLSLQDLTHVPTLSKTLGRLEAQVRELRKATSSKFVEKKQKQVLKQQLASKENAWRHVSAYNEKLKSRCDRLKVAIETSKSVLGEPDKSKNLYAVVTEALVDYGNTKYSMKSNILQTFVSFDEDDPLKKKEAEQLIEYVEHFNDLFDFGQFQAAAIHAANSPKGILRSYETMIKFKQADAEEGNSPLLIFCDALMATASAAQPLTGAMSVECIKCALGENRVDFAMHWLAQGKLTYSIPLGDLLRDQCRCGKRCSCTLLPLAQTVYMDVGANHQAVSCLCRQGKYAIMLEYSKQCGKFSVQHYRNILLRNPSAELAEIMLSRQDRSKGGLLSFASVVGTLLDTGNKDMLLTLIRNVSQNLPWLTHEVLFEEMTGNHMSTEKWFEVINLCQEAGWVNIAIELLASIAIRDALNKASIAYSMDYIS